MAEDGVVHGSELFCSDVIQENREKLLTLKDRIRNHERLDYRRKICECRINVDEHLKAVKTELDLDFSEVVTRIINSENQDAAIIDQEIDVRNEKLREDIGRMNEEIKKNEEERERRHQEKQVLSGNTRSTVHNKQHELLAAIQTIADELGQEIDKVEKSWQDQTRAAEDAKRLLDTTLLGGNESIVAETERVEASVTDVLGMQLHDGTLEQISCLAFDVKYVKDEGNDDFGRIVRSPKEWKCVDSIKVTHQINQPTIVGYIDDGNVIITDSGPGNKDTYVLNTNTKYIQKVISSTDASYVVSCAVLTDGKVACGKYTDDAHTGCITVFDSHWEVTKSINIQIRGVRLKPTKMYVAADQAGMIIASEVGQRKIHVINPDNGMILSTIRGMDTMALRGVQSSGHIIAQASPADRRLYIVAGEGNEEEMKPKDVILNASVAPVTDHIYTVTSGIECYVYVIWNITTGDETPNDRVEFPLCERLTDLGNTRKQIKSRKTHIETSRVIFASSTEMIASDGDSILIYRKS